MLHEASDRLYFVERGYYQVQVSWSFQSNSTGFRGVRVRHYLGDGTVQRNVLEVWKVAAVTSSGTAISDPQPFGEGHYLQFEVWQNSGSNLVVGPLIISVVRTGDFEFDL
jgi:hypothetical protein